MPERSERALKLACVVLAALLGLQLFYALFRHNPLEHATIPVLPALAATDDAKGSGGGTNSVSAKTPGKTGTNGVPAEVSGKVRTIAPLTEATNQPATNLVLISQAADSNSAPVAVLAINGTNSTATNLATGTNFVPGTNAVKGTNSVVTTNAVAQAKPGKRPARNPRPGAGKKAAELPPIIEARIEKIKDSEILAQVDHPAPMGLLGIAGEYAFLRASNGQTGMVKEGGELGGLKLLRIGVNRVLVEDAGEKKELTIFEGYGSETLLPKANDKPNETITKTK